MAKTMITIMFMYDTGKSHTLRLSKGFYKLICITFLILPVLLGLTATACYYLWEDNSVLNANALRLQIETNTAKALAENLSIFKKLLAEDHPINSSAVLMNQAEEFSETMEQQNKIDSMQEQIGPEHLEFPAIDTKEVAVENISAKILDEGKIRISLDLRNPDTQKIISGYVNCIFVDSNGMHHPLKIAKDLRDFKINRFKRVVFLPDLSTDVLDKEGSILIEVYDKKAKLLYRDITPIEK